MTAELLRDLVRDYFSGQEWSLTWEVGNGTGAGVKRHADAIAMNLWPSRGLSIHGIELKISRTGWQKELANPAKAEEIHQHCDYWWLITAHGVVRDIEEIPPGWGFMEMSKRDSLVDDEPKRLRLKLKRQASRQERKDDVGRGFVAAILRAHQRADGDELVRRVNKAAESIVENRVKSALQMRGRDRSEAVERLAKITKACEDVGIIWLNDEEICRAVAFVMKSGISSSYSGLGGLITNFRVAERTAANAARDLRVAAEALGLPLPEDRLV